MIGCATGRRVTPSGENLHRAPGGSSRSSTVHGPRRALPHQASNKLFRAVIQTQLGVTLASLQPARPYPAPGAGAVSGVRLSAASTKPELAVDLALACEGFQGLKGLTVWVDPAIHRQLRMMALELDRSAEDMLREAIGDLFQKHGRPRL